MSIIPITYDLILVNKKLQYLSSYLLKDIINIIRDYLSGLPDYVYFGQHVSYSYLVNIPRQSIPKRIEGEDFIYYIFNDPVHPDKMVVTLKNVKPLFFFSPGQLSPCKCPPKTHESNKLFPLAHTNNWYPDRI